MIESSSGEFTREFTDDIKKTVIAFANSNGGVIYVGRDDDGNIFHLPDLDCTLLQITNSIRDSIQPDVTMFVRYETDESGITITVREGAHKPYFLPEKGLKPTGVYVRQGASSVPASFGQIREMIKFANGDMFETARSLNQDLTFREATEEFERRGVVFGENQMRTLGIIGTDGLYTNLGLLLSDQCMHTIKFAVFNGTKKGDFRTRKEVDGSLFRQMRSAFDFSSLSNNLAAVVSGLDRIEQFDYPETAVREAILNAIVHRDYGFSGSIIINIYDDRMEFVSLGGLAPGLQAEDLFVGVSQPRNEKLANVFYRLKHIEAYGIGLRLIMQYYEDFSVKPEIIATHGAFSLILPNMNYAQPLLTKKQPITKHENQHASEYRAQYKVQHNPMHKSQYKAKHNSQHNTILDYLQGNSCITNATVQELLSVKQTRAYTIIREMVGDGLIAKNGTRKEDKEYVLALQ
jgi:ATP-dependent DNA helicase RecG